MTNNTEPDSRIYAMADLARMVDQKNFIKCLPLLLDHHVSEIGLNDDWKFELDDSQATKANEWLIRMKIKIRPKNQEPTNDTDKG